MLCVVWWWWCALADTDIEEIQVHVLYMNPTIHQRSVPVRTLRTGMTAHTPTLVRTRVRTHESLVLHACEDPDELFFLCWTEPRYVTIPVLSDYFFKFSDHLQTGCRQCGTLRLRPKDHKNDDDDDNECASCAMPNNCTPNTATSSAGRCCCIVVVVIHVVGDGSLESRNKCSAGTATPTFRRRCWTRAHVHARKLPQL